MPLGSPDDTIAAVATAPGSGALAVVRISGPHAISLGDNVFSGRVALDSLEGFRGAHGWIHRGDTPLDEVVAWVFRAPHSYTGEHMVEFSCHGGGLSAGLILEALWEAGARPAEPGEFTRRAFLQGRIDLTRAEAVAEVIAARGRWAHDQALAQLKGGLSDRIDVIAAPLREVLGRLTVYLDFDEDVPEPPDVPGLRETLAAAGTRLRDLADKHASSVRVRDGVVIALVGRPNVGKSSLLNALAGYDRAIVHSDPGTTRDVVDVRVEWGGVAVRLVDTAGIRSAGSSVEEAGIKRSERERDTADYVFWVVDGSRNPEPADHEIGASLGDAKALLVTNKADLEPADQGWVKNHSPLQVISVSARTGAGLVDLRAAVEGLIEKEVADLDREDIGVANERHARELAAAGDAVNRAQEILGTGRPAELAAADLHLALAGLGRITGEEAGPELLDHIFSNFCIGK